MKRKQFLKDTQLVRCPKCGVVMGMTAAPAGSTEMEHALSAMQQSHRCPEKEKAVMSQEGTKRARKAKAEAVQAPVEPEEVAVRPTTELEETNADVIVAQRLEAEAEARRGDSEEQTPMEILAGVAPRKGRLQKGDYPVWLQKINAGRLAAKNARLAEKAAAKEAKKAAKGGK